jgi:hypothetical protein
VIILSSNGLAAAQDIDSMKLAARTLVAQMGEGDRTALIHLETQARLLQSMTGDKTRLLSAIDQIREVGAGHALYDAVNVAVAMMSQEKGRRGAIMLLTHQDNSGGSTTAPGNALAAARNGGVPVFAVAFGAGLGSVELGAFLKPLVADTFGVLSLEAQASGLGAAAGRMGQILREQYQLSYSPASTQSTDLTVSLSAAAGTATGTRRRPACGP